MDKEKESLNLAILAWSSSLEASLAILDILPKSDLCEELTHLVCDQIAFATMLLQGDDFDEDSILDYCDDCNILIKEIQIIKNTQFLS